MQFTNEGSAEAGFVSDLVPEIAEQMSWGVLVSKQHVEDEVDMMLRAARGFWEIEPDQVMRMVSAMTARCAELSIHLHRLEGRREWKQVRTLQVERLQAELDRQFRVASRLLEVRRQDLDLTR